MSYIFDSSAIFRAVKNGSVDTLAGNFTIELARYELGNILWKESTLHKRVGGDELKRLVPLIKRLFNLMQVLDAACHEQEILNTAGKLGLTFYDSSYVFYAQEKKIPLITEDENLINRVKSHVKTSRIDKLA